MPFPSALRTPFLLPVPDSPKGVAFELFKKLATPEEVQQLMDNGGVVVQGHYARYIACQNGGSGIIDEHGQLMATGCFVLVEDFPALDHMIANYLMFKSPRGERIWWTTACYNATWPGWEPPTKQITRDIVADAQKEPGFMHRIYYRVAGNPW